MPQCKRLQPKILVQTQKWCVQKGHCMNHWLSSYLVQLCRLCSGILDVRNVLKHKVKLGLGTGQNRTHLPSVQFLLFDECFNKSGSCKSASSSSSLSKIYLICVFICKWWKTQKCLKWSKKKKSSVCTLCRFRRGRRVLSLNAGCCEENSGLVKNLEHSGPRLQHTHLWGGLQAGHSGRKPRLESNFEILRLFVLVFPIFSFKTIFSYIFHTPLCPVLF